MQRQSSLPGLGLLALSVVLAASAASAQADTGVRLERSAARVVIIPENRADVAYQVTPSATPGLSTFQVRHDGAVLVLDQGLGPAGPFGLINLNCMGSGERARVRIPGHGIVAVRDLPLVTIRTPKTARVAAAAAVYGEVRPADALELSSAGCGDWRVGTVKGALGLRLSGSGDVRAEGAGGAVVNVSGSGDVELGGVKSLDVAIAGSGDVHVATVDGPIAARITGAGDLRVDGGAAPSVQAKIAGSGDIRFGGVAGSVSAQVAGSGDVDIARATGPVAKRVAGSGEVNVGR